MPVKIHPKDLTTDHILAENVFKNDTLVLPKGTKLTKKHIDRFSKWGMVSISVSNGEQDEPEQNQDELTFSQPEGDPDAQEKFLNRLFHQQMMKIVKEERYGELLKPTQPLTEVRDLFIQVLRNEDTKRLLMNLYHHDEYTFTHSLDIFILGYFTGKKALKKDIENFAIGCLLHDIGKLHVPEHVLKKETKLTKLEYEMIQNHTIKGQAKLLEEGYDRDKADLARSHHEKLKGTGYPDQLHEGFDHFSDELRLLMVIDVYSALTLNRPYRDAFKAPKALTILLSEQKDYDQRMLYTFIDTLKIYPPKSNILLSNGQEGTVTESVDSLPTLSRVSTPDDEFMLPIDKSIFIERITGWNESKESIYKKNWFLFIQSLLKNDDKKVLEYIIELEDGLKIEDVYILLFEKAIDEINHQAANGRIRQTEAAIAFSKLKRIMGIKSNEYSVAITTEREAILFLVTGENRGNIKVHLLADLLVSLGYKLDFIEVKNMEEDLPTQDLLNYISEHDLRHLILSSDEKHLSSIQTLPSLMKEQQTSTSITLFMIDGEEEKNFTEYGFDCISADIHQLLKSLEDC